MVEARSKAEQARVVPALPTRTWYTAAWWGEARHTLQQHKIAGHVAENNQESSVPATALPVPVYNRRGYAVAVTA